MFRFDRSRQIGYLALALLLVACTPLGAPTSAAAPALAATLTPAATLAVQPSPSSPPPASPTELPTVMPTAAATAPPIIPAASNTPGRPGATSFPPAPGGLRQIAGGLARPLYLTQPADGTDRLFVVEQPGVIQIIEGGKLLPTPFLDLRNVVNASANEQGLLGLAFHPKYKDNGLFFVNYTDASGNTVIARYAVSTDDPDLADPESGKTILSIDQPFPNHNGGDLVFGPDGYLYIGMGDGGSQGDPRGNGQNLNTLLGKLLRIDVNTDPYAIPPDNPFKGRPGVRPEIWAYGLRNPWRFSFDRATGDLYIADVGQDTYEEIDFQPAGSHGGQNYGWNFMEGLHPYKGVAPSGLTPPVAEYPHQEGGCSVTGGYVYHGTQAPQLTGLYLFGDYCSGLIWALARTSAGWQRALVLSTSLSISSFGEDQAGELYVIDHQGGAVYRWEANP